MQNAQPVLKRIAQAARDGSGSRPMTPAKALRQALPRAAEHGFGLALAVTLVEQISILQAELTEHLNGDGLFVLLDGSGKACGGMKMDVDFVAALIEAQTLGLVRAGAGLARPITPTDAAIVAPFITLVLSEFYEQMEPVEHCFGDGPFQFGDQMEDARTIALMLEEEKYDAFRIAVDLGGGAKSGLMTLVLPKVDRRVSSSEDQATPEAAGLRNSAMNAPVALSAVVARLRLPLSQIAALRPGMSLPFAAECLQRSELLGSGGHLVAKIRLGQLNGFRAAQLCGNEPEIPTAKAPLPKVTSQGRNLAAAKVIEQAEENPVDAVNHMSEADGVVVDQKGTLLNSEASHDLVRESEHIALQNLESVAAKPEQTDGDMLIPVS